MENRAAATFTSTTDNMNFSTPSPSSLTPATARSPIGAFPRPLGIGRAPGRVPKAKHLFAQCPRDLPLLADDFRRPEASGRPSRRIRGAEPETHERIPLRHLDFPAVLTWKQSSPRGECSARVRGRLARSLVLLDGDFRLPPAAPHRPPISASEASGLKMAPRRAPKESLQEGGVAGRRVDRP